MDCEIDNIFDDSSTDVGTAKRMTSSYLTLSAPNIIYNFDIFVTNDTYEFIPGCIISSVVSFTTLKQLCPS
jgi:hypothetical protein